MCLYLGNTKLKTAQKVNLYSFFFLLILIFTNTDAFFESLKPFNAKNHFRTLLWMWQVVNQRLLRCKAILLHQISSLNWEISPQQKPWLWTVTSGEHNALDNHFRSWYISALPWQKHLVTLCSSKIFRNRGGPRMSFGFCKLFCGACFPVCLPPVCSRGTDSSEQKWVSGTTENQKKKNRVF